MRGQSDKPVEVDGALEPISLTKMPLTNFLIFKLIQLLIIINVISLNSSMH